MLLVPTAEPIPLVTDANGVVRINKTRVTLDTVVTAFLEGSTAEEIKEQYPSLQLSDIYSVIGYYLRHQTEVDEYLLERQRLKSDVRQEAQRRFNPVGIRDCPRGTAQSAIAYWQDAKQKGKYDSCRCQARSLASFSQNYFTQKQRRDKFPPLAIPSQLSLGK
ncbi:DUF433 domain-containing protein [Scytonema sp. PCC 10023]|uniref:DUF433 domain-containing protein n=1 Tax=Scytonema sp. PCC 10023 TaxID=1680591 RepID=UPI0039C73C74